MTNLHPLKERIEKATEGSRELDAEILRAFYPNSAFINGGPKLTTSLDAALALVEKMLPGCQAGFQPGLRGKHHASIYEVSKNMTMRRASAQGNSPALAVLSALLTALKETSHVE